MMEHFILDSAIQSGHFLTASLWTSSTNEMAQSNDERDNRTVGTHGTTYRSLRRAVDSIDRKVWEQLIVHSCWLAQVHRSLGAGTLENSGEKHPSTGHCSTTDDEVSTSARTG
jgi:hypothetical protein